MNANVQKICNAIRREAHDLGSFPMDVFPTKVQDIILTLLEDNGFRPEYTACAALAAVSHAIGNTHHIRIKRDWTCSPALYFILVGRPGLGKTPPLRMLFRYLYKKDSVKVAEYQEAMKDYRKALAKAKEGGEIPEKPILLKSILSDFTPEALVASHAANKRGILVFYDEIMGMLNTVGRYTASNLIELFLMAFSMTPLDNVRCSRDVPQTVLYPCITLAGTLQTAKFIDFLKFGLNDNGFTDRVIFAFPQNAKIDDLEPEDEEAEPRPSIQGAWQEVLEPLLSIPLKYVEGSDTPEPVMVRLSPEAQRHLFNWRNEKTRAMNEVPEGKEVDTRPLKLVEIASRIALSLHFLKWSCEGVKPEAISKESVVGAIRLIEFYEEGYRRLRQIAKGNDLPRDVEDWLTHLPDTFYTSHAVDLAQDLGIRERRAKEWLSTLVERKVLIKVAHGEYRKYDYR